MSQHILIKIVINVILPLTIGGFIYIYTRPNSIYFLSWLQQIIPIFDDFKITLPEWIIYNLPDGLWIFSFINLMLIIWNGQSNINNLIWYIIPILVGLILEIFYGTFDIIDVLFIILGGISSFYIFLIQSLI